MTNKINQFYIGQKTEFFHKIIQDDVDKFIALTGDNNPLHCNEEFASKTSFKGIVTHGMLSASFISTIVGKQLPGNGALWVSQNLKFLLPVRINDELNFKAEIINIDVREKMLTIEVNVFNQINKKVLHGLGQVKILNNETVDPEIEDIAIRSSESSTQKIGLSSPLQKIVLITGASGGIGTALAEKLAKQGYIVVINYSSSFERALNIKNRIDEMGGKSFLIKADVCNEHEVNEMYFEIEKHMGVVSYLVNNASHPLSELQFSNLSWNNFQAQIDVQVKGAFNCIKRAISNMESAGHGSIINIGSTVIDGMPPAKWTTYSLAKSALASMTKSLANEFGNKGIRFNMVSPGMTDTNFISDIPEKQRLIQAAQTPLRRLANPYDVANAVAFLLSDEAAFITGENLIVSGGKTMF